MIDTPLTDWIENHPNVFINFYTPWCHWCQELEPIWELTAETVALELLPINLIKVNCEQNIKLCENLNIRAFPTLRLYRHHKPVKPDYHDHRTLDDFIKYIHDNLEIHPKTQQKIIHDDHVGCRVEGNLILNRYYPLYSSHNLALLLIGFLEFFNLKQDHGLK